MPVVYSWLDRAEVSKNRFIRKAVALYKYWRKQSEPRIGKFVSRCIHLLPKRVVAYIIERSIFTVRMPYSSAVSVRVEALRDISRANFPHAEPATVQWIEEYFHAGDVLWDVGANIGAVSLIAVAYLNRRCTIYSFEPAFATFRQLCENVILNRFQEIMTPYMFALSNKSGLDIFLYRDIYAGTSGHSLSQEAEEGITYALKQPVMKYSIDDLCVQWGLTPPTHIKIDVDGHDFEVLKGATNVLRGGKVRSVLIEKNQNEHVIRAYMQKLNFKEKTIQSRDNLLFIANAVYADG